MGSTTRIDNPTLYEWDLDENSTRFDHPRSWPNDETLRIQFSALAAVNGIVACACLVLIVAILRSKRTRKNPFHLYLLMIAIPDFLASASCFLTCVMSAPKSMFFSEAMCGYQAFYLTFAFTANAWMNAVIVHHIHTLLKYSQQRRKYFPPTRKRVFFHTLTVYTYSFIWGMLATFHVPGFPLKSKLYYGFACFPMEYDIPSAYIFYVVFLPCILLIPCIYSLGVLSSILWNKLMPSQGKRRKISIFLIRLVGVYFLVWLPFVISAFVGNFVALDSWIFWGGAAISHFQGAISAGVVYYTNDDIRRQIKAILCCGFFKEGDPDNMRSSTESIDRVSSRIRSGFEHTSSFKISVSRDSSLAVIDDIGIDTSQGTQNPSTVNDSVGEDSNSHSSFERQHSSQSIDSLGLAKSIRQAFSDSDADCGKAESTGIQCLEEDDVETGETVQPSL